MTMLMEQMSLDEIKDLQLEILRKVADFCESQNLVYCLGYGTLLGAVRHKGYIPWDDDIDIIMPRKDYNRFLESFNGSVSDLAVMAPELDLSYYAPYANVYDERTILEEDVVSHGKLSLGVKIDIFPFDYVPDDYNLYHEFWTRSRRNTSILHVKNRKLSFCHGRDRLILAIRKLQYVFISVRRIQRRQLELLNDKRYSSNGPLMDVIASTERHETVISENDLFPATKLPFEGIEFRVPRDYDKMLTVVYGDYMQLPPESERVVRHCFKAYRK